MLRTAWSYILPLAMVASLVACEKNVPHKGAHGHHESPVEKDSIQGDEAGTGGAAEAWIASKLDENPSWNQGRFVDVHGREITSALVGSGREILSFFYTRCPDADMCPRTVASIRTALKIGEAAGVSGVQVHLISLDPDFDTSDVLAAYQEGMFGSPASDSAGVNLGNSFRLLRPDAGDLARITELLGYGRFEKHSGNHHDSDHAPSAQETGSGMIDIEHSMAVYIFKDGRFKYRLSGNWSSQELANLLRN